MVDITIVKSFTLTHDDGHDEFIPVGAYDFPEDIAGHWFVRAHSDNPEPARPKPGTPMYAEQHMAQQRRRLIVTAAIEQEAQEAANAVRRRALGNFELAQNEEQMAAEEADQAADQADAAAQDHAVRTGTRPALPRRSRPAAAAQQEEPTLPSR